MFNNKLNLVGTSFEKIIFRLFLHSNFHKRKEKRLFLPKYFINVGIATKNSCHATRLPFFFIYFFFIIINTPSFIQNPVLDCNFFINRILHFDL